MAQVYSLILFPCAKDLSPSERFSPLIWAWVIAGQILGSRPLPKYMLCKIYYINIIYIMIGVDRGRSWAEGRCQNI